VQELLYAFARLMRVPNFLFKIYAANFESNFSVSASDRVNNYHIMRMRRRLPGNR